MMMCGCYDDDGAQKMQAGKKINRVEKLVEAWMKQLFAYQLWTEEKEKDDQKYL